MYSWVKRVLDLLAAILLCPFVFLISIPIWIAIKLDDGGPLFYVGKRVGKDFEEFNIYKFRSMVVDSPDIRNPDGSTYSASDDLRLTRVGRILRETSIDEMPQVINVLTGKMSFVGPRPSPTGNRHTYPEEYLIKFTVLPGITGYAQAQLRNKASMDERIACDIFYAQHKSFVLDLKILFLTAISILKRKDIYKE